jgi:hypothetical protein
MGKGSPPGYLLKGPGAAAAEAGGVHDAHADARRYSRDERRLAVGLSSAGRSAHDLESLISAENMANHKPSARNR